MTCISVNDNIQEQVVGIVKKKKKSTSIIISEKGILTDLLIGWI